MTQEKQLLLQDLCARLPYGVKGKCEIDASYDTSFDTVFQLHTFDAILNGIKEDLLFVTPLIEDKDEQEFANEEVADGIDILDFKPYLHPMSSMTEEEKFELKQEHVKDQQLFAEVIVVLNNTEMRGKVIPHFAADWCDKNMFDFRGLIPKGLAIEVTENNNPYKD